MEATVRAIGYGAYAILYGIFILAVAIFALGLKSKIDKIKRGQPETRSERLKERIKGFLEFVCFQKRLFQDLFPGLVHAFIFWGFLVFALGYAVLFLQAHDYYGGLVGWLFGGRISYAYNIFTDFFALLVMAGVVVGMIRRYIWRPERLDVTFDAGFVLMLIFSIMATNLLAEGALIRLGGLPTEGAAFAGRYVARLFATTSEASSNHIYIALWWAHISIVLGFLTYLPHSKHFHIVLAPFNVLLRNLGPYGALTKLNIEGAETFGAAKPYDLRWKSLLDLLACAECGRCQDHCPAYATEKPLSPKKVILDLKDEFLEYPVPGKSSKSKTGSGGGKEAAEVAPPAEPEGYELAKEIGEDAIWACTTCRACEEHCPVFIEHVEKIVEMRRNLVLMASRFPQEVTALYKNLEANYNPWPIGFAQRADWAKDLALKTAKKGEKIEVLIWTGCAGAFDDRNKKVVRSLVSVLRKAVIEPYFLGTTEKCCGDPARRSGNEYLYQTLAEENVTLLNSLDFKTLITTCPHCYNTILNEYPQFGGDYNVEHYTTFVKRLVDEGRLALKPGAVEAVAYHDSCYLGRYGNIYEVPRELLAACGVAVKDASKSRAEGFCCGAGGARMWMEESLGTRINHARLAQLKATGATKIYTACPYCLTMLADAIKEKEETGLEVSDICELVDARTGA